MTSGPSPATLATPPDGAVVHLDTSFLIRALVAGSPEAETLRRWLARSVAAGISTLAWAEFLCGPMNEELPPSAQVLARRLAWIHAPLGTEEASRAADLFNRTGRRRGSLADCIIAATAMISGAALATSNPRDFAPFVEEGLELAQ